MRKLNPAIVALWIAVLWLLFGGSLGDSLPWLRWLPINTPGPRHVLILRESADDSSDFSRMVTNLRDGDVAKQLEAGKHRLDVLDDDDPAAAKWLPQIQGIQQPAIVVVAPPDKVLAKQTLPAAATAADVLAILKANGG